MPNTPYRPSRPVQIRPSGVIAPIDQDEVEKQLALRDVMEHAVRQTRAVATAKPMQSYRSRPIVLAVVAIATSLACAFVLIARPDSVYGPDPAKVPGAQREAYTRFAMYLTTQRVMEYREAYRRLPESLEAMGESWEGISYRVLNDSVFELRALGDSGKALVVRSDQRLDPFLGTSLTMIRRRPR